jgi:hypothetical protein
MTQRLSFPADEVLLFVVESTIRPLPRPQYVNHTFQVPEGIDELRLEFEYVNEASNTLYISIYEGERFRGNRMKPGQKGNVRLELWMNARASSPGAVPGEIAPGKWRMQVDIADISTEQRYKLKVSGLRGQKKENEEFKFVWDDRIIRRGAEYYRGELHCHSDESDGKFPVRDVIKEAERLRLDFLAMTDHITISQWARIQEFRDDPIVLMHSCEITSRHGHANMHHIHEWVDVFTCP